MLVARTRALPVLLTGAFLTALAAATLAAPPTTVRLSVSSTGTQANTDSSTPFISSDGRFVVFSAAASTLVPGDVNGMEDIFMRDTVAGTTTLLTAGATAPSFAPVINATGRYVAFWSANAFRPGDTNNRADVYVRDTWTGGVFTIASVATDGTQGDSVSTHPSISGDGRFVAFESTASNLVPDDNNGRSDIFVRDMLTHRTTRVSVATDGTQANGDSDVAIISVGGNRVAFHSTASNLVPGDTNGTGDVFVRDLLANTTTRVSVAADGAQGDGDSGSYLINPGGFPSRIALDTNGRFVAFRSAASNLVSDDTNGAWDIFVRDLAANTTTRVSVSTGGAQGNGNSYTPSLSGDGGYLTFASAASNLVEGDTNAQGDVFGRDMKADTTARLSVAADGTQANMASDLPAVSLNARFTAFRSYASNLVPGKTTPFADVFMRGPLFSATVATGTASVSGLSATLNGVVNPAGAPATAWFDYGPTTAYGSMTVPIPTGSQNRTDAFLQGVGGLAAATTYHFRAAIDDGTGPVYGGDSYFATGAPLWGTALRFDDASEIVMPFVHPITGQFTVECWARPADVAAPNTMLGSRGPSDHSFDMKFMPTGIHGDIGNGLSWLTTSADAPMTITPGTWYHVAYVVTPTGYTLYVNGEQKASGIYNGVPVLVDGGHHLVFGNYGPGRDELFRGDLDDVRVWTVARTAEEIRASYNHPMAPNTVGLAFYHRFDSGSGNVSVDNGVYRLSGSFSGNPVWVPSTVPLPHATVPDALGALRIASGLDPASPADIGLYAFDPAAPGVVDLNAALAILRAATGIAPIP